MKSYLFFLLLPFFMMACQSDESKKRDFAGTYDVTLHIPDAKTELKKAKKDMQKEMEKAKKEIQQDIEKAKDDLEQEMGRDNNLGDAIGNFVEGMGKLAEGMTDLGEHLGNLGIDLSSGVLEGLRFRAEFEENGDVTFGKKGRIRIGGDTNRWDIQDGKFYLWEDETEKEVFEMKDQGNGNWDLVGKDVIFHLESAEQ
jgi:seryl-tRNA synthetase